MKTLVQATARWACAVAILIGGASEASAQSILSISNHATGETSVFTANNAAFSVVGDGKAINISVGINAKAKASIAWNLRFEAPEGEAFTPGRYNDAGCPFSMRSGRAPGMQVTDNNPICRPGSGADSIWGSFAIRQIAYDSAGEVTALEILFSQRAGSPDAAPLTGLIRYQTAPLSLALHSDARFAWGEISSEHDGDTGLFQLEGTTDGLQYTASVPRDRWVVAIQPPSGQVLKTGSYATRNSADPIRAGLSIRRGLGPQHCISSGGALDILEMDVAPTGEVLNLYATFEYRCEGRSAALRGTIRYLQ